MRKLFVVLILIVASSSAFALSYRHSIGLNLGTINGVSYKGYVGKNLHFVIQADLYYQMSYSPVGILWFNTSSGNSNYYVTYTSVDKIDKTMSQSVMASPSFMYQGKIEKWESGTLNWYAGAGVAVGFAWGGEYDNISLRFTGNKGFNPWLKFGEYAIAGIEFCFAKAPLSLGLDLRPGVAQHYIVESQDYWNGSNYNSVVFDWGANLTLRYCFGK